MKSITKLLILFLIWAASVSAQSWHWVNPMPQGNQLNTVAFINANTAIACGVLGTIIKTTDGGANWRLINSGSSKSIQELSVATLNTIYASGDSGLVLKSTNAGETWQNVGINTQYSLWNIQFFDDMNGYVSGLGGKFYKTSNGGLNWTEVTVPQGGDHYSMYFTGPQSGYLTGFSGRILKTVNSGANWTEYNTGRSAVILDITFAEGIGYGACSGGEVVKTTNDGQSWFLVSTAGSNVLRDVHFLNASTGMVLDENGRIFRTTNGGLNWSQVLAQNIRGMAMNFLGSTGYQVGGGGRIFKTVNSGLNWTPAVNDKVLDITGISFAGTLVGYASTFDGGVIKTYDAGASWSQPNLISIDLQEIKFINANTGIAIGAAGPNMFRTTNGGINWTPMTVANGNGLRALQFITSADAFITGDNGIVYKTTDAGLNWISISTPTNHGFLTVHFVDDVTGYVAGYNSKVYRTVNGGLSWAAMNLPGSIQVNSIYFLNSTTGFAACGFGYLYKTTNGGLNWQYGEAGTRWLNEIKFVNQQTGYIASDDGVIYKTTNTGINWVPEPRISANGLTELEIINSNTIYAGGYYGSILRFGTSLTSEKGNSNEIPSGFSLEQNFPNPFNPATTIKYSVPEGANVTIKVYDITGREVAQLVNEYKAAGAYKLNYNASALASGIYFYTLKAENFTETKKMLLVK